jgi:diadenosine tetraphosphate (Ap4A) HIT family hydrolase
MADDLHPKLASDTIALAEWSLSRVRLMNDQRYGWIVLIPRAPGATEIHDLSPAQRTLLIEEIARASNALSKGLGAKKINVGALGIIVPQLHIHIVARNEGDPAWPGPVWGHSEAVPYDWAKLSTMTKALQAHLG